MHHLEPQCGGTNEGHVQKDQVHLQALLLPAELIAVQFLGDAQAASELLGLERSQFAAPVRVHQGDILPGVLLAVQQSLLQPADA